MSKDDLSQQDIERAKAGDRDALERLLVDQLPSLRGFLRLRVGGRIRAKESCSDLAQSVCREALAELDEFEYRGEAAFRNWLFKRAQRKVMRRAAFYGAGKRDAALEAQPPSDSSRGEDDQELLSAYAGLCSTPSRALASREEIARIEAAVDELPEAQRDAVVMHSTLR